jgi:hypothetical protein
MRSELPPPGCSTEAPRGAPSATATGRVSSEVMEQPITSPRIRVGRPRRAARDSLTRRGSITHNRRRCRPFLQAAAARVSPEPSHRTRSNRHPPGTNTHATRAAIAQLNPSCSTRCHATIARCCRARRPREPRQPRGCVGRRSRVLARRLADRSHHSVDGDLMHRIERRDHVTAVTPRAHARRRPLVTKDQRPRSAQNRAHGPVGQSATGGVARVAADIAWSTARCD